VHSHENHILAALQLAVQRGAENVYLHAFLDGRDTPPRSAEDSLRITQDTLEALGHWPHRHGVRSLLRHGSR
jgi:2,3-bisphosphoglycerate-independent phosphoglycerate mutase